VTCEAACCGLLPRLAAFQFLSREEKHTRVATTNMKSHFIDGLAKSSDIREADIVLPEGYPYENGSNTRDQGCAQAQGAALLLCGDWRLSLIHL
jgi:hypothetical protein